MKKKKILFLSESSFLGSGYAAIAKEIIGRFHFSQQYEVAEFASYASPDQPQVKDIPWKFYPNVPSEKDEAGKRVYHSNPLNQFGLWKFESICLDFEPDIVCAYRDYWYDKFVCYSPFRKFYRFLWMPTVDAYPLNKEWISDYTMLDGCLSYTKWGKNVLQEQCRDKINFMGTATPGADIQNFYPIPNKLNHKKQFRIEPDEIIIGFVARNQVRKLFPELFKSFVILLEKLPPNIRNKTFLYLHTGYPDHGWDIPNLLKEFGLASKVYFTYFCKNCAQAFASFYQDIYTFCQKCNNFSATILSGPEALVSTQFMNNIYNLFDIYVQFAMAEGLGIPAMEAGSAGVPLMAVDYSGMRDYITELGAIPISVVDYKMDIFTGRFMAVPDAQDFIQKLFQLILLPSSARQSIGFQIRKKIEKEYTWDNCYQVWKKAIDNLPPPIHNWRENGQIYPIPKYNEKKELSNLHYINWLIADVLKRPDLLNSYFKLRLLKDLNWRKQKIGEHGNVFSEETIMANMARYKDKIGRQEIYDEIIKAVVFRNEWEKNRAQKFGLI